MKSLLALLVSFSFYACGTINNSSPADAGPDGDLVSCARDNGGCDDNADCTGSPGETVCTCSTGYSGDGLVCALIEECSTDNGGCDVNADCTGSSGNLVCTCQAGFYGDGLVCADINECLVGNGGCDPTATCTNTPGDRSCACSADSLGDGLSCRKIWSLVGTLPDLDLKPSNRTPVVGASDSSIFFAPTTGDPAQLFFRAFNVNNKSFSPNLALPSDPPGDFCACGLAEVFLSDGTDMFLMGNYGKRYSPTSDTWNNLPFYYDGQRGEAAGTYDAKAGVFLLIGGRDTTTTAGRMKLIGSTYTFMAEPGTLPIEMYLAVAHTVIGTDLSYVAGGYQNNGVGLLSHLTGSSTWTRLADAPSSLEGALGMGQFNGLLWVAKANGSFSFYDASSDAWTAHQIDAPAGIVGVTMVGGETYAVSQVDATSPILIHRLNAIE